MAKKKAKKKEKKMARKKPARKAAPRKRSASKKSARKKTAKRSVSKPVLKARKPTRKAKRVTSRTRPAAPATASKPFAVIPRICSIKPPSQSFLPFATVHFNCEDDCWLVFSDPDLFGFPGPEVFMHRGDNPYPVRKLFGRTKFWIKDCAIKVGPADIIVP